jgi:ankyrin repeat protein
MLVSKVRFNILSTCAATAGCRVDTKDVAGHTPLHHCTTSQCTPKSLEIASMLVAHGASTEAGLCPKP